MLSMLRLVDDPKIFRDRAQEARATARQIVGSDTERTMLGIAEGYERLAKYTEERLASQPPHT